MKKALIVFVALMLALPAVSFAGSATSRWDMTLGGYVKMDIMYADQALSVENRVAQRDNKGGVETLANATGNLSWAGGETRLNWAVKGPDAMGAKTSAFVEGEFRGRTGGTEYGLFALRHAYFQMIWPKTQLLFGQTWQAWGLMPSLNSLAFSEMHFNKGATRTPQIRLTQKLTNNFTGVFALQAPYATSNTVTSSNTSGVQSNPSSNGLWPDLVGDISFASDACGKVGPFGLKFGLGGFYGKDKFTIVNGTRYNDQKVDRYGLGFYWYVPIIPEKKSGKAGALGFSGEVWGGKGMGIYLPAYPGAYNRNGHALYAASTTSVLTGAGTVATTSATAEPADIAYAQTRGGWAQATFYLTNQLFVNAIYGAQFNSLSSAFVAAQPATTAQIKRIQNAIFNVMYDVNPAIRFGLEYDYVTTAYAHNSSTTVSNKGSFNSVRFGAYYFF